MPGVFEWVAVALAGAFGGLVGSVFLRGASDVPWPEPVSTYFDRNQKISFVCDVGRSILLGGLASFVVWSLYNLRADFSAIATSPGQVATGVLIGLGGVTFVNNLARRQQTEQTVQAQADAIISLAGALEAEANEEEADAVGNTPDAGLEEQDGEN